MNSKPGFPSGWRLDFVTRWLYRRQEDNRPSNVDSQALDWTRYHDMIRELEASDREREIQDG